MFESILFISSEIIFHNAGPMTDKAFWPVLILRNGCFSIWQLFFDDKLDSGTFIKFSLKNEGIGYQSIWKQWNMYTDYLNSLNFRSL